MNRNGVILHISDTLRSWSHENFKNISGNTDINLTKVNNHYGILYFNVFQH